MKFLALVKKELREALPWQLTAAIVFLLFGSVTLRAYIRYDMYYGYIPAAGEAIKYYNLRVASLLSSIGPWLFITSLGLGLVLGGRQFWMPNFQKTWSFNIHRSVKKSTVLWAKFTASVLAFVFSLGVIWSLFYLYASSPGIFPYPPRPRIFIEGWLFIIAGIVVYLGTTLAGLSKAKWYTTRMFGIAFSALILTLSLIQTSLFYCFATIIAGIVILVSQIFHTFINREF